MKKIAIINQKGGAGKTTLAALLAKSLPGCLAVDLDPQAGLTALLAGEPDGPGVFDLIMGDEVKPRECEGFHLLQADERLDAIYGTVQPFIIKAVLKPYRYQFIVMDCPPTVQGISRSAALAADIIITPADISPQAKRSTLYTIRVLKEIKKRTRVYLVGKEPGDARGTIANLTREFVAALGDAFAGFIPKSVSVTKAAAGKYKEFDFIKDMIHDKSSN